GAAAGAGPRVPGLPGRGEVREEAGGGGDRAAAPGCRADGLLGHVRPRAPDGDQIDPGRLGKVLSPMMQADFQMFEPSKGFRVFVQPTTKFKTITLSLY